MRPVRAHALLRLYPPAWRDRYQDEVEALLDQHAATFATFLDLLWGALDARLDPTFTTERMFRPMSRIRTSMIIVFCAFAFFVIGVLGFSRLTDPRAPFDIAAQGQPAIGAVFRVIVLAPQVGLGLLILGGAPIALDILWRAWRGRNWRTVAFFVTPPVLLVICAAYVYLANTYWLTFNGRGYVVGTLGDDIVLTIAAILLFGSGVASVVVVAYAVARSEIGMGALRIARWAAVALTLTIGVEIGAIVFWGAQTYTAARWLYDGAACGASCPGAQYTNQISVASLAAVVAWMLAALIVAAIYTVRGFTAGGSMPGAGAAGAVQPA